MTVPVSAYLLQLHTVHEVAILLALYTVAQYTISMQLHKVGAFLQATSRVPRWWIGERPPDMAASCDIYK